MNNIITKNYFKSQATSDIKFQRKLKHDNIVLLHIYFKGDSQLFKIANQL